MGCQGSPLGDLPDSGIKPMSLESPALAGGFFTTDTTWEAPEELGMLLSFVSLYKGHVSENFP